MGQLPEVLRGLRPEAVAAIEATKRGLDVALARVGASDVRSKGGLDIVTGTDIAAEEAVKIVLSEQSGFPVIGEESGGNSVAGLPCWLVDPICGTRNFAAHISLYSVNVALVEDGRPTCCAVADGSTGEIHVAQERFGAYSLRGAHARRARAANESRTLVVEGWPSWGPDRAVYANFMKAAAESEEWELRSFGTTLSLAFLATARIAAYVLFSVSPVHSAAGALLASEAGARVTDLEGNPWSVSSESLVAAADDNLHSEVLDLLDEAGGNGGRGRR